MSNIAHRHGRLTAPGGLQNQMLSTVQASDSQNSVPVVCWPVSLLYPPGISREVRPHTVGTGVSVGCRVADLDVHPEVSGA